jgi:hypothetical protein
MLIAGVGGRMNQITRRLRAAVNPASTAATRWWCHSALRHMLTGYGPTARQRRLIRQQQRVFGHGVPVIRHETQGGPFAPSTLPSAGRMNERATATDDLLSRDDRSDGSQIR